MRLKGNVAADMIYHGAKKYGETGTRMAKVTLQVKVKEEDAKTKCGADFHRVAFGQMVKKKNGEFVEHSCGTINKPNLTFEVHDVDICGTKVRVCAEVPKIVPVEDEPAVTMHMVLPIEVTQLRQALWSELTLNSGDLIECDWEPVQMDLPGTDEAGMTVKRKDNAFGNPQPTLVDG